MSTTQMSSALDDQGMTTSVMTVVMNSTSYMPTQAPGPDFYLIKAINFYSMGVVIPIGLLCNTLSLAVFAWSKSLRRTVTGHFLIALAIADSTFLAGDFIRWLNPTMKDFDMGLNFMNTSGAVCKITFFLRYMGKFASSWITVAITAQRFLTVVKALEVARISTVFRVRLILGIIGVVSLALTLFPFWTTGKRIWNGRPLCAYLTTGNYSIWNTVINGFGSLILPAVIILILTGIIVYDLIRAGHRRRTSLNVHNNSSSNKKVMERNLSAMLVAVALAFLCLRLPYTVAYYLNEYKEEILEKDDWMFYRIYCAAKITDVFATMNYAVNFFLYCLVGSTFRKHLVAMLRGQQASTQLTCRRNLTTTTSLKTSNTNHQGLIKFQPLKNQTEAAPNNNKEQFS